MVIGGVNERTENTMTETKYDYVQTITQKTKYWSTRTSMKTGGGSELCVDIKWKNISTHVLSKKWRAGKQISNNNNSKICWSFSWTILDVLRFYHYLN